MLGAGAEEARGDMNRLLALLLHQGVLDEHFLHLHHLQDDASPDFVAEVVAIYFHESERLLRSLRALLQAAAQESAAGVFPKIQVHLNQMMGSSSSIGAKRVRDACVGFRAASHHSNRPGCLRALAMLENEYCYLKNKLNEFFQMEQQRVLAAAARYPLQN